MLSPIIYISQNKPNYLKNSIFKPCKSSILNDDEEQLIQDCHNTTFKAIIQRFKDSDYGLFNNDSKYDDTIKFIIYFLYNRVIEYNKSNNSNGNSYTYVSKYFNDDKLNVNNILDIVKTIEMSDKQIFYSIVHNMNKFTITQDIAESPDKFQLKLHYNNINLIFTYYTNSRDPKYGSIHVQKFQINNEMQEIQDYSSDYE